MNQLNKKQKIILSIIATIGIIAICYYFYTKEETSTNIEELIIENKTEEENTIDQQEDILVHITGCVQNEGVYELEENSRIKDVIEKAGGIKEDADLTNINLAEIIEDGTKIHIPSKNETQENIQAVNTNIGSSSKTTKVNINTATQEQLETLPGIGSSTALKIIEYRKENGKFSSIEQIKEVSGIGESKYKKIKDYIVVK